MKPLFGKFRQSASNTPLPGDREILERLSIGFFSLLCGAYALAVSGSFSREALLILLGVVSVGTLFLLARCRPSRVSVILTMIIVLFSILVSFSASPTIFSGRDEGSYLGAALRLVRDHSLVSNSPPVSLEFSRLYGEGKAQNVPGFFYTPEGGLATQFPLGYIVWLGTCISIFGLAGISIANAATLALTLGALFSLLRKFLPVSFAVSGIILAGFSFPFLWMSGRTLSENLATSLFLLLAVHLVSFAKRPSAISWTLVVAASILLFLTRIEGFLILPMVIASLFFFAPARDFLKARLFFAILPVILAITSGIGAGIFFNLPFYRSVGKAILTSSASDTVSAGVPFLSPLLRNLEIFWTYGMISTFAMALLGLIFLLSKKHWFALLPPALAVPTAVYFVSSHISPDHPWLLRRFAFSLWPIAIFLAIFALAHLQKTFSEKFPGNALVRSFWFLPIVLSLLVIPAFPAVIPILGYSENETLLADTKKLSAHFSGRDVIFVDRLASGDPYSMIADPLSTVFAKNAIYIFNPEDIARFDRSRFDRIFLIARTGDEIPYQNALASRFRFEALAPFELHTSMLSREIDPGRLPLLQNDTAIGTIFLLTPI